MSGCKNSMQELEYLKIESRDLLIQIGCMKKEKEIIILFEL